MARRHCHLWRLIRALKISAQEAVLHYRCMLCPETKSKHISWEA